MKRVLWFEIFIIVTFAVRASEYPRSGWHPPPPIRYSKRSKGSHQNRSKSNSRHSEWTRMRRPPKPFQEYHFSGYQSNDDDRNHRQNDHYQSYQDEYEESDQYHSPPRRDSDLRNYKDYMDDPEFHPDDMSKNLGLGFRRHRKVNDTRQRHRATRNKYQHQRRRVNRNNQAWPRDNIKIQQGLSKLKDKLDDGRHAGVNPTTTTQEPLHISDVKVPIQFLRIEYMISFSFLGLMYGLGFLVMFQSLCVTTAKITVYIVYYFLLKYGVVRPPTIQDALEQMPPL